MASGSEPGASVGVPPERLASAPAGRQRERAGSLVLEQDGPCLGFGERGPASTLALAEKASAPALGVRWSIPKPVPARLQRGERAGTADLASFAPTCGPGASLGSSSSLVPSRSGSAGASGAPAPSSASKLSGGGGSGTWGFCSPAARARSRRPAPPLGLLRLRVMLLPAPLPRSTCAAAATAPLSGQQPIWRRPAPPPPLPAGQRARGVRTAALAPEAACAILNKVTARSSPGERTWWGDALLVLRPTRVSAMVTALLGPCRLIA